jgi:sulfur relay (sulfurtransferase) DsrC/TusE family protein
MDFTQYNDEAFADLAKQVKAEELRRNRLAVVRTIRDFFERYPDEPSLIVGINFNEETDGMHFMPSIAFYNDNEDIIADDEHDRLSDAPGVDWLPAFDFDGDWADHSWYNFKYTRDFKDFEDYEETNSGERD